MKPALERARIDQLVSGFRRSPEQLNIVHESDAEIVRVSPSLVLALTSDAIAEEIEIGLYRDPYQIGWMAVIMNLSDLAAVGARPIGLLMSEVIPPSCGDRFLRELQRGIQDACSSAGTHMLGGDTNTGRELVVCGTAIGHCPQALYLTRRGCQPGDLLYATGQLGLGNAFALSSLLPGAPGAPDAGCIPGIRYRPHARLIEGQCLVGLATSCIDTSDGAIAAMDELMRVNNVGIRLNRGWEEALHPGAGAAAQAAGLPPWLLLAGQHGEFELLFTVPGEQESELISRASANHWRPIRLGTMVNVPRLELPLYDELTEVDSTAIRNLGIECRNGVGRYLEALLELDKDVQKGLVHHASC